MTRKEELSLSLGIAAYLNTASDELFCEGKPNHSHKHLKQIHECMRMWQKLHNNYFYPEKKKQDNTMNHEQKYKKALERAKVVYHDHRKDRYWRDWLTELFPELKESEDEKIRYEIIAFLEQSIHRGGGTPIPQEQEDKWLAWLEKQGKKKSADRTTPKFKVGNWIVGNGGIFKITQYEDEHGYNLTDTTGCVVHFVSPDYVESNFHLWTIDDTKEGDVLYCKTIGGTEFIMVLKNITRHCILNSYCRYNSDDGFDINVPSVMSVRDNPKPATKEQRDWLFSKMKEAGYEWDSEKKELKKIVPKTLDADKVIEWLNDQACLGRIEDIEVEKFVE